MEQHKIVKYLNKLSNVNIESEKFGLYLTKLNYWYQQIGSGGKDKNKNKNEDEKKKILEEIKKLYDSINFPYNSNDFINNYKKYVEFLKTKTTDIEYSIKVKEVTEKLMDIIKNINETDPFLYVVCKKINHYKNCDLFKDTTESFTCRKNLNKTNAVPSLKCYNIIPKYDDD
jgi:hypothetical protein